MSDRVWSVTALIAEVNGLLEQGFADIRVEGEATNVNASGRGHLYFTLKDESAAIDCVMWATRARRLRFALEDGLAVETSGSLTIYPQRGRFQLVVDHIEPQGAGALQLAFEQLKKRLEAEGLFDPARKRTLPALPQRVGIVTSASGAALRDMLKVLRRHPHIEVVVAPAAVQGDGAALEIAAAISRLIAVDRIDVIIVGRGGGSLEDLWAFNEEPVARAIAASPVPVISAVGHEVDFTIADFVADIRGATPTHGAELIVARIEDQERRLREAHSRLRREVRRHVDLGRTRLAGLVGSSGLARVPQRIRLIREQLRRAESLPALLRRIFERSRARFERAVTALDRLPSKIAAGSHRRLLASRRQQVVQLFSARLRAFEARIDAGERALAHLGPQQVLDRGYSITFVEGTDEPLRDAARVRRGIAVRTRLAVGSFRSIVAAAPAKTGPPRTRPTDQRSLYDEPEEPGEPPGE